MPTSQRPFITHNRILRDGLAFTNLGDAVMVVSNRRRRKRGYGQQQRQHACRAM